METHLQPLPQPQRGPGAPGPGTARCPEIGRHEEAEEPRALQRPGKKKATARQLHSIKCGSRAKVRRQGTASPKRERERAEMPSPGQPRSDHRGGGRREENPVPHGSEGERKTYVEHRPLRRAGEIYGRAGTVGSEPGVGEPPRARAPAGPKRWLLTEPRAACYSARGRWWQGEKGQARSKLPGHARSFRVVESGEAVLGSARGSGTPVPSCEHPRRLAGPPEGVRELRRTAAAPGGAGRGKEH